MLVRFLWSNQVRSTMPAEGVLVRNQNCFLALMFIAFCTVCVLMALFIFGCCRQHPKWGRSQHQNCVKLKSWKASERSHTDQSAAREGGVNFSDPPRCHAYLKMCCWLSSKCATRSLRELSTWWARGWPGCWSRRMSSASATCMLISKVGHWVMLSSVCEWVCVLVGSFYCSCWFCLLTKKERRFLLFGSLKNRWTIAGAAAWTIRVF